MQPLRKFDPHPGNAYLAGMDFAQAYEVIAWDHPFLAAMIDRSDLRVIDDHVAAMNAISWEFEGDTDGGRGVAYNVAQRAVGNRARGMERLLGLFSANGREMPGPDCVILDALAGDGTVSRFAATYPEHPTIVSADLSALMIEACMAQGLPCIRQSAARSLLRDNVLDGVLIAYGSHHLPDEDRRMAAIEARRTLKPGGRFVLHDFETGGATDAWFGEVVHPFSGTGHPHPHFSRPEMLHLMDAAGFHAVDIFDMDDPFVLHGASAAEARAAMLRHLYHMYGLCKLDIATAEGLDDLERRADATIGRMSVVRSAEGWTAHLPRMALVAIGTA